MRFACRHCHGLTYRTAQEHDTRVDTARRRPERLWSLLNEPISRFI
jgi:hypothetical protein